MKGILLDKDLDLEVNNGALVLGDTKVQEAGLLLGMNAGEWKLDPRLGPGLLKYIRSTSNRGKIDRDIRQHLAMDRKDINEIKNLIEWRLRT